MSRKLKKKGERNSVHLVVFVAINFHVQHENGRVTGIQRAARALNCSKSLCKTHINAINPLPQ